MTIILALLLGIGLAVDCDYPPGVHEVDPSTMTSGWEAKPDVHERYAKSEQGHYVFWRGDACEPDAMWGRIRLRFVWMQGMEDAYQWRPRDVGHLAAYGDALRGCVAARMMRECTLIRNHLQELRQQTPPQNDNR